MWDFLHFIVTEWIPANRTALLIDLLLTTLLAFPLCMYLLYVWPRKAQEIDNCLSDKAKQLYLALFQRHKDVKISEAHKKFSEIYYKSYGRRWYVVPIVLVLLVAGVENFILADDLTKLGGPGYNFQIPVAAIAGAYVFVAASFLVGAQRRNLSVADVMRGALRLAIAIPFGYAVAALVKPEVGAFIAFAVGVFPLNTVATFLRQLSNKKLGLEIGAAQATSQVAKLSGVDASIADRIEEADITTITQLAWCDPVQLTMRTNLYFGFVLDICSQALAWVYFGGDKLEAIRVLGLRGAVEIRILIRDDLESDDAEERKKAHDLLPVAAAAAKVNKAGLMYAFEQIVGDPYTDFLYNAWNE